MTPLLTIGAEVLRERELLTRAFAARHRVDSHEVPGSAFPADEVEWRQLCIEPQRAQHHWRDLFEAVSHNKEESHLTYEIGIKGCRDYYYYSVLRIDGTNRKQLLSPPFFIESAPKRDPVHKRGMADFLLTLAQPLGDKMDDEEGFLDLISWFDIRLICVEPGTLIKVGDKRTLELKLKVRVNDLDPLSRSIELDAPDERVLLASPNYRRAVAQLARLWRDPLARVALITGATGSGKERLVDLLSHAMLVDKKRRISLSAAELSKSSALREALAERQEALLPKESEGGSDRSGHTPPRSIIFIDEIHHKSAKGLRPGLLRLISNRRLRASPSRQQLRSEKRPRLWCTAGEMPLIG